MFVILTGDHPRHKFLVNSFCKIFKEITWIIQKREQIIPEINKDLSIEYQKLELPNFSGLMGVDEGEEGSSQEDKKVP